ncbi:MAG: hypothetical protein IJ113_05455 [Eggerthellaceae bacterium]|nr:hypothetical protein [Eggerthellaceae bacterium]
MFEHDYLMRMFFQLFEAIQRSLRLARGDKPDPQAQARLLEDAVGTATALDGGVLLSLSPDSIADIMDVSGTDPRVAEYVGRTIFLISGYLAQAGKTELATLRAEQALALAEHYGFSLDEELGPEAAMEAFLEHEQTDGILSIGTSKDDVQ